jgi:hypothetical protein
MGVDAVSKRESGKAGGQRQRVMSLGKGHTGEDRRDRRDWERNLSSRTGLT